MAYLASGAITAQNTSLGTNTPTTGSFVWLTSLDSSAQAVGLSIAGTYTGALTVRGSVDGVTYTKLGPNDLVNLTTDLAGANIPSAGAGLWEVNVVGLKSLMIDAEASFTGTANASFYQTSAGVKFPDPVNTASQGYTYSYVAPNASDVVVKASAGELTRCIVEVAGSAATSIYDNASAGSGSIVGSIPATPTLGQVFTFNVPCLLGITVKGAANTSGLTVLFD